MTKVTLTIDGKKVEAEAGATILSAAESAGIQIPHYCYHPGLKLAGNCRMCLVQVEKMPKPLASCVAPVQEGMEVMTESDAVVKMRKSVMEFLLINHPLDCPTCDQSGECRLQDYYMDYDRIPSRFHEEKVHKAKMEDLGAGVALDCERCIACTRCIRVCQEVAGSDELTLSHRGDHVTITTFPGKKLSNPYAGNVVDVCPVGALTSMDFRFKKRVWFLKRSPSICPGCSRGCNIFIDAEASRIYRLIPRHNPDVNKYWMCDEGRYGFGFVNEGRLLKPHIVERGTLLPVSADEALSRLSELIKQNRLDEIGVVAHAGETEETLSALNQFAMEVLETRFRFYSRFDPQNPYSDNILMTADKNPNQAGIDRLEFKPLSELRSAAGLIVLRDLKDQELSMIESKNIPVLALFAVHSNLLSQKARVVLPIPSYAEQEGHFINVDGKVQKLIRAFEPRGESRLLSEWLVDLAGLLQPEMERKEKLKLAIN